MAFLRPPGKSLSQSVRPENRLAAYAIGKDAELAE
jgi:hypothetical protein